jgi:asparagine synthase (glutamine-hydrolysing)
LPLRTEAFAPGDRLAPSAAWHIVDAVTRLCADRPDRQATLGPWFVVVSAKVVAVSQRRVSPLWQIRPGVSARMLARVARRGLPWLGEAWTMQVAIDEGGLLPVAAGTVAAGLGHAGWAARLLPEQAALLSPARADAMAPANASVVSSPFRPDDAAEVILEALRHALPPGPLDTLAGCAVVSADEAGSRVLGFAAGPYVDAVPDAEATLAEVLADNPCGQGQQRTPIVLAFRAL